MSVFDLSDKSDYAGFLAIQRAARMPVEEWAARFCPFDILPPTQTPLITDDLIELGSDHAFSARPVFAAPADGALGVAWALGGSSLGNRAMLAGLRKRGAAMPVRFLDDSAMPAFFARIRRRIEQPAEQCASLGAMIQAAHAVFATFTDALEIRSTRQAA